ncbi:hypothetical protein Hanom_Chr03g00192881 [Helianthus anomalus]
MTEEIEVPVSSSGDRNHKLNRTVYITTTLKEKVEPPLFLSNDGNAPVAFHHDHHHNSGEHSNND